VKHFWNQITCTYSNCIIQSIYWGRGELAFKTCFGI